MLGTVTIAVGEAGSWPGGEGAFWGRGDTYIMHDRSRMTIAISPSRPFNIGMEHVGLAPTRHALRAPSVKHREVFGGSHEQGEGEGGTINSSSVWVLTLVVCGVPALAGWRACFGEVGWGFDVGMKLLDMEGGVGDCVGGCIVSCLWPWSIGGGGYH